MFIITHLPQEELKSLNVLDDQQVVNVAKSYRLTSKPVGCVSVNTIEEAYRITSDVTKLTGNTNVKGNIERPTSVGDIISVNGDDYVVLAFGFHKLSPVKWTHK
jgi:hypothetical protein